MSRFRFDISGAVFVEEKDFFGALMADPSGAMTDRMREALKNTNAEDLFGDGYNGWNLGSDEALTITVTDTETGAALIYNSDETWRPYQHNQPADAGHVRVLSAQVNENGEQSVTRIVGELSIEDFRTALGEGFQLRLVTPVEAAAPDLLLALVDLYAYVSEHVTTPDEKYHVVLNAATAIGKATGETK